MQHRSVPGSGQGVYWLGDPATLDPVVVGEAVACLGRLAELEFSPPAFCLTAPPFEVQPDGSLGAGAAAVARMYARLARVAGGPEPAVVVRSALVSRSRPASWVPGPWTFYNVAGVEALREAVTECVAPYASDRARAYRAARSGKAADARLAVLVQRFITADACAIVISGADSDTVTIRSRWGLGDLTGPDGWDTAVLRRPGLAVIRRTIAEKRRMTVAGDGGVIEVDVPATKRLLACLSDVQAGRLAELAAAIQVRLGRSVEAEVAVQDGRSYLLWCVPGAAASVSRPSSS
jgi:pyruvate,water dikinase